MKNHFKKLIVFVMSLVVIFSLFTTVASAVLLNDTGSITLNVLDKEAKTAVDGVKIKLYYIASANIQNANIDYLYTEAFKANGMELSDFSDSNLALHLMNYAVDKKIPCTEKTTDASGKVTFENLSTGAYLLVCEETKKEYMPFVPFVVSIPMYDSDTNNWLYHIDASPKVELKKDDENGTTFLSVKKEWQNTSDYPQSITVNLLKDGKLAQVVTLSKENNWYFKWDNLPTGYLWTVAESGVPEGYTVSYSTSQNSIKIINRKNTPDTESTTEEDELIYTGQLNWPVPVFSIAGLLLFSIGWAMLNLGKKEEATE